MGRGIRNIFGGGGNKTPWRDHALNLGKWSENLAGGLIGPTRKSQQWGGGLTGLGVGAQTFGNLATYGPIVGGTLGYALSDGKNEAPSDGSGPQRDRNGVLRTDANEEMVKVREKFQKDMLGGATRFSPAMYQTLSEKNKWTRTSVESMGADKYKALRRAALAGHPKAVEQLHARMVEGVMHDDAMLKQVGSAPYVLPGVARTEGGAARILVMAPVKNKEGKTSFKLLQYGIEGEDGE